MYDVIIIGDGPAGISASLYIKRADFNVAVIASGASSLKKASKIENYYGFENGISGTDLHNVGVAQARNLGIEIIEKEVIGIKYVESEELAYEIIVANQGKDEKYIAKVVILATGANRKQPNIQGIKEFEGRGVSFCAVCDGAFYKKKDVAVLGSKEYAIGEMEELLPIANSVVLLTNGEKALENRNNVEINEKEIREFRGDTKVREVLFKDGSIKKIDGIFIAQGTASSIDFARKIGAKIENNVVLVNEDMETTVRNIYACGDCTGGILQVSKAVYEGTKAGLAIIKRLREER